MLAHLSDESRKCASCGTYAWEWEEDKFAYEPAGYTCFGCQLLDAAREGEKPGPGVRMILIPRQRAEQINRM